MAGNRGLKIPQEVQVIYEARAAAQALTRLHEMWILTPQNERGKLRDTIVKVFSEAGYSIADQYTMFEMIEGQDLFIRLLNLLSTNDSLRRMFQIDARAAVLGEKT